MEAAATSIFTYRSVIETGVGDVFRWHERPDALFDLLPSRKLVRVEQQTGGVRDGGVVTFSIGLGPVRMRWEARHYGYVRGRQFCDEQVRGPFKVWRHTHRFEPISSNLTLYEDRVEYAVPGGSVVQRLAERVLQPLFTRAFARRHRSVAALVSAQRR